MVMLVNIRRGAGKSVVGQVPCPLDLKGPKYDRLKFCIATVLLPRPTPLNLDQTLIRVHESSIIVDESAWVRDQALSDFHALDTVYVILTLCFPIRTEKNVFPY